MTEDPFSWDPKPPSIRYVGKHRRRKEPKLKPRDLEDVERLSGWVETGGTIYKGVAKVQQ